MSDSTTLDKVSGLVKPAGDGRARSHLRIPPQAIAVVAGLAVWELLGWAISFPFLPPFSRVLQASWNMTVSGQILGNLAASLVSLAIGYGLAVVVGVTIGALMGRFQTVEHLLDVYVNAFLAAPTLIFVPVVFALFGVSRASQVAVVFLYACFIILVNTQVGIRTADTTSLDMARSFGASDWQIMWKVMVPGALPMIMPALRIGMARAVKGMINGEMFIALIGLGALIKRYGSRFEMEKTLGVLLIIILVALAATGLIQALERRLLRWMK